MFMYQITKLLRPMRYLPQPVHCHTETCPAREKIPVCPGSGSGSKKSIYKSASDPRLKRATHTSKVRLGFIPDNWFLFFHSKTGVSGPYVFGIVFANYLLSKEIYILEHEYYTGVSIFLMVYFGSTRLGPEIGKSLDKHVDDYVAQCEKGRKDEIALFESIIKEGKDAQLRAEAQKILMDAKKENIAMQLEAVYRERLMHVYRSIKGRLDYQVKLQQSHARIQQKWMIGWILENVRKSITPEFEQQCLHKAIQDIASIAGRAK